MYDKKWIKVIGLALSLPSTIFALFWLSLKLAEAGFVSKPVAILISFLIITFMLGSIVYYANKRSR